MKTNRMIVFLAFLFIIYAIANVSLVYGKSFTIKERSPGSGRTVDRMVVPLTVTIHSDGEPVRNAYVWFYVDGEPIGHDLTDGKGFAGKGVSGLKEFGRYKWKVRVEKGGYERIYSSEWTFNYQPRPVLTLQSDYGETYGEGDYTYNTTAVFGVEPAIVNISEYERVVFVEWMGVHKESYSGPMIESNVTIIDDITEYAIWNTQYYLNMSCEVPPAVRPESGWYDENDIVGIYVDPLPGVEFLYWVGSGNESYSGTDLSQSIRINGPINQEAVFIRERYYLDVESEIGNTYGSGEYLAWDNVSFGIDTTDIYLGEDERMHFTGWRSDSGNGYNGNHSEHYIHIAEYTTQEAEWVRQYYVNVSCSEGGNASTPSGWMDEKSELLLTTRGEEDYQFTGWTGEGEGSYDGLEKNHTITIEAPIYQKAVWKKRVMVSIESELPVEGGGEYLEGDTVTIRAKPSEGMLVRKVFKEWSGSISSTSNPLNFTIRSDVEINAVYTKDYMILLVGFILIFILLGIVLFKLFS